MLLDPPLELLELLRMSLEEGAKSPRLRGMPQREARHPGVLEDELLEARPAVEMLGQAGVTLQEALELLGALLGGRPWPAPSSGSALRDRSGSDEEKDEPGDAGKSSCSHEGSGKPGRGLEVPVQGRPGLTRVPAGL
jgi:hypothetical protein